MHFWKLPWKQLWILIFIYAGVSKFTYSSAFHSYLGLKHFKDFLTEWYTSWLCARTFLIYIIPANHLCWINWKQLHSAICMHNKAYFAYIFLLSERKVPEVLTTWLEGMENWHTADRQLGLSTKPAVGQQRQADMQMQWIRIPSRDSWAYGTCICQCDSNSWLSNFEQLLRN